MFVTQSKHILGTEDSTVALKTSLFSLEAYVKVDTDNRETCKQETAFPGKGSSESRVK